MTLQWEEEMEKQRTTFESDIARIREELSESKTQHESALEEIQSRDQRLTERSDELELLRKEMNEKIAALYVLT